MADGKRLVKSGRSVVLDRFWNKELQTLTKDKFSQAHVV